VIFLVFEKALEDVFFQDMYAQLCSLLSRKATEWCASFLKVRRALGARATASRPCS
jgi:hypothetical protein